MLRLYDLEMPSSIRDDLLRDFRDLYNGWPWPNGYTEKTALEWFQEATTQLAGEPTLPFIQFVDGFEHAKTGTMTDVVHVDGLAGPKFTLNISPSPMMGTIVLADWAHELDVHHTNQMFTRDTAGSLLPVADYPVPFDYLQCETGRVCSFDNMSDPHAAAPMATEEFKILLSAIPASAMNVFGA